MRISTVLLLVASTLVVVACGDSDTAPTEYQFESRFEPGESSVSYSGQTMRHVLISDLTSYVADLTDQIDTAQFQPESGELMPTLGFYYEFDSAVSGTVTHQVEADLPLLQLIYDDISSGKNLRGKIAGRDGDGARDYRDWDAGAFSGWAADPAASPDALVTLWFSKLDELAAARTAGTIPLTPGGSQVSLVYLDDAGRDYRQLLQKFLLGAVAYAQATDDYLDEGLLSDNTEAKEGATYTALEHSFDEAFGYFGGARDYASYSDDEISGKGGRDDYGSGYHDSNADGVIDLKSEINFGVSVNAGKRDRGSHIDAPTDLTADIFNAFLRGRHIIASANGELSADEMADLEAQRDIIVLGWEQAIAATCVHYINDVLQDMGKFGTADYSYKDHAKHWSELKGFALGLQFNPRKRISDADFAELHELIGDRPALPNDSNPSAYADALRTARSLLVTTYEFAPQNAGDENGLGGW